MIQLVEILRLNKHGDYQLVTRFPCKLMNPTIIIESMRNKKPDLLQAGDHVMVYTLTEEYDLT